MKTSMKTSLLAASMMALALCAQTASATTTRCTVVGVTDGDTLTCLTAQKRQIKVRLAEIDTPERAQPFGTAAKKVLSDMVYGQNVELRGATSDRYGRQVATVVLDGQSINEALVEQGYAWAYRDYLKSPAIEQAEARARHARRGLWSEPDPVPPWLWRKSLRNAQSQKDARP